jgi:hypothetical protein
MTRRVGHYIIPAAVAAEQVRMGYVIRSPSLMKRVEEWSAPTGAADDASMLAIERCG